MNFSRHKNTETGELLSDPAPFRRLIGRLIYLTHTRPDITFDVHHLSQFIAAPTSLHHRASMRILRYLKQHPGQGIFFDSTNNLQLKAFCDLDWVGCPDTRRSVTGYIIYIGNSPICWKSKKQQTVSRSSSEAEYHAITSTTCEIQWLHHLMQDLKLNHQQPSLLYCDSISAIEIASNQVFHERTKHIEIDCHLIREKVKQGLIKLLHINTHHQQADILTKALPPALFNTLISKLGLLDIYA